jgi:hypothetical protein
LHSKIIPYHAKEISQPEGQRLCLSNQSLFNVTTKDPLPFEEGMPDQNWENLLHRSTQKINTKAGQLTLNKSYYWNGPREDHPNACAIIQEDLRQVIDLIHLCDTFVLAGTRVGKS